MNSSYSQNIANHRKLFIELAKKRVKPGSGSSIDFLKSRTWNYPTVNIHHFIKLTPFVLIGGVATRMYMAERKSTGIDILISFKNIDRIEDELKLVKANKLNNLSYGGSRWQLEDKNYLNVVALNRTWVKEAIQNPNYNPDKLPIISLPYLVLSKLISHRSQDLADIR